MDTTLSIQNLLNRIDQDEAMCNYFPSPVQTENGKICEYIKYKNPFREDLKPGCNFRHDSDGVLRFYDWAYKEYGGSVIDIVMLLHNTDIRSAMQIINSDYQLGLGYEEPVNTGTVFKPAKVITLPDIYRKKSYSDIRIVYYDTFEKNDYLKRTYELTDRTLKFFKFKACKTSWIITPRYTEIFEWHPRDPLYALCFDNPYKMQIYRPKQKARKWRSNLDPKTYFHGYDQLPDSGKYLLWLTSRKDIACVWQATHVPGVAIIGEGNSYPPQFVEEMKERFYFHLAIADNDEAGINAGKKLQEMHNIPYVTLDRYKDPANLVKHLGMNNLSEFINETLYERAIG